jgi:hypothetical protein
VNFFVETDNWNRDKNTFHQTLLPPKQVTNRDVKRRDPKTEGPRFRPLVHLMFTDQRGTRWLRHANGEVEQTTEKFNDHLRAEGSTGTVP